MSDAEGMPCGSLATVDGAFKELQKKHGATEGFSCRGRLLCPSSQVSQLRAEGMDYVSAYLGIGIYRGLEELPKACRGLSAT